jgi:hypothetical protein
MQRDHQLRIKDMCMPFLKAQSPYLIFCKLNSIDETNIKTVLYCSR